MYPTHRDSIPHNSTIPPLCVYYIVLFSLYYFAAAAGGGGATPERSYGMGSVALAKKRGGNWIPPPLFLENGVNKPAGERGSSLQKLRRSK